MYDFLYLFLVFFIYSIIGYCLEVFFCLLYTKKFNASRGYLLGPYIPVFGFGAIIMVNFLDKYRDDFLILFVFSMVICSLVEYFVSLLLEKIFNLRWWDYSHESFNVNGRICLKNSVLFGLGGIIIVRYFNPLLNSLLSSLDETILIVIGWIFFGIIITDAIVSTYVISKLKIDTKKYINKDATHVVKEQVADSLRKYNLFYKRMLKAFPHINLNVNIIKLKEFMEEQMTKTIKLVKIKDKDK
jgi:uncharacterized membrane protein